MSQEKISSNSEITITLPDGARRVYAPGVTGFAVAESISKSLAKAAIAVKIDGVLSDLSLPIQKDSALAIIKREDSDALELIRHDAAHVLAEAVQNYSRVRRLPSAPRSKTGFITILRGMSLFHGRLRRNRKRNAAHR